jgi:hypothetical protein
MSENRLSIRFVAVVFSATLLALVMATSAHADAGSEAAQDDTVQYSFGWSALKGSNLWIQVPAADGCLSSHIGDTGADSPDEPIRTFAFKNADGNARVQFNWPKGSIARNRRLIGSDLRDARREHKLTSPTEQRSCNESVVMNGQHQPFAWSDFDDTEWLTSPYYVPSADTSVPNGGTVYALLHQEFRAGSTCSDPASSPTKCWFASITSASSTKNMLREKSGDTSAWSPDYNCWGRDRNTGNWVLPKQTPNEIGACYKRVAGPDPWGGVSDPGTPPGPTGPTPPNLVAPPTAPQERAKQIVGTIPYQYSESAMNPWGRHGYKELTNIIRAEGNQPRAGYFMMTLVSAPDRPVTSPQAGGTCLLWTDNLNDPSSWKAWDGQDFMFHPQPAPATGAQPSTTGLVCEPVFDGFAQPWSLTYNTYLRKYMLVGQILKSNPSAQGVYYALSDNLINWSAPQLILLAPDRDNAQAACKDGITYPVVLDKDDPASHWPDPALSDSTDPNFDHPGATPDLYFNHTDVARDPVTGACSPSLTIGGNLSRMTVDLRRQRRATLQGALIDPTYGFTGTPKSSTGSVAQTQGGDYDSVEAGGTSKYATVTTTPPTGGGAWAYGKVAGEALKDGDEVWYGAALFLPVGFRYGGNSGYADLFEWDTGADHYGGIAYQASEATHRFRLFRATRSAGWNYASPFFRLPQGRWTWVEVHQRFSSTPGAALNEVYVDGRLVLSTTDANGPDTDTVTNFRYGFPFNSSQDAMSLGVDRASVLVSERGAIGAPSSPTGLRATAASGTTTLAWNAAGGSPAQDGYRIYRQTAAGVWEPFGSWDSDTSTADPNSISSTSVQFACESGFKYRVSSYRQDAAPRNQDDDPFFTDLADHDPQGAESIPTSSVDGPTC